MIKLKSILKEDKAKQSPYMYSSVGFSCDVCKYYHKSKDGKHMCSSKDYQEYMGTSELVDESGKQIEDPTKWCSNWFLPYKGEVKSL